MFSIVESLGRFVVLSKLLVSHQAKSDHRSKLERRSLKKIRLQQLTSDFFQVSSFQLLS